MWKYSLKMVVVVCCLLSCTSPDLLSSLLEERRIIGLLATQRWMAVGSSAVLIALLSRVVLECIETHRKSSEVGRKYSLDNTHSAGG